MLFPLRYKHLPCFLRSLMLLSSASPSKNLSLVGVDCRAELRTLKQIDEIQCLRLLLMNENVERILRLKDASVMWFART